ncbi:MAG: MFS transporter, partial [Alphaproteobacteria bacterium]
LRHGLADADAATLLTAFTAGNVILQLPIAWFADKVSRSAALVLCAVVAVVCAVALPFALGNLVALWLVLVAWGGVVFSFYMLALGMLGASFRASELIGANAAFIIVYNVGGALGPIGAGALMDAWAPEGLPLLVGLAGLVILTIALTRRGRA